MYKVTVPINSKTAYKYREETLAELKRSGAHRAALTLHRDLESKFSSDETLMILKEMLEYFENNGFETLVWLGETFGHDRYSKPGKFNPYTNIKSMVRGDIAAFCPMDNSFADDFCTWIKNVAKCGAETILLDDDFRMGPGFGCCCDKHMKAFEDELGEKVDTADLEKLLLSGGKNKYRDAWLKVQGDGMRSFARKLRNAADEINPNIRIGACAIQGRWDDDGANAIEIGDILAGDTKPLIRFFGAPYHTTLDFLGHRGYGERYLADVIEKERIQANWCRGERAEILSEGDTYPRPRFACNAAFLECFDMILRADGSFDGILKYMFDYVSSPNYETGFVDFAEDNKENYKIIESLFSDKKCIGIKPYVPLGIIQNANLDRDKYITPDNTDGLVFDYMSSAHLLTTSCLPITYEEDAAAKVVFGESARHIPESDLYGGVIVDAEAAQILTERGIDVGIEKIDDSSERQDGFHYCLYEYYKNYDETVRLEYDDISYITPKEGTRILTEIDNGNEKRDFVFDYINQKGQGFLVLPFCAKNTKDKMGYFRCYLRRKVILDSLERIGAKALEAYPDGNYTMLYPMVKRNENEISIGLWNLSPDKVKNAKLKTNVKYEEIEFINCNGRVCDDGLVIESCIYPYEFAAVKIKVLR